MSFIAVRRTVHLIAHLKTHGAARFNDLAELLQPISRTALSMLLKELTECGELTRDGRNYQLSPGSVGLTGGDRSIYRLPPALRAEVDRLLRETAVALSHSCALFARVGSSTMKIVGAHNLAGTPMQFSPPGYEWPLVPFHGFAQVFLAHERNEALARDVYYRWRPYLRADNVAPTYQRFRAKLRMIQRQGHAIEYKEETGTLMRLVVPVPLGPEPHLRFAVGLVAHPVHLLEIDRCLARLLPAAASLRLLLAGKVPAFALDESLPLRPETD